MLFTAQETVTHWGIDDDFVGVTPYPTEDSARHAAQLYRTARVVYRVQLPDGHTTGWLVEVEDFLTDDLDIEFDCD